MTDPSRPSTVFYWYTAVSSLVLAAGMPPVALLASGLVALDDMAAHPVLTALFLSQTALTTGAVTHWMDRWRRGHRDSRLPLLTLLGSMAPSAIALTMLLGRALSTSGPTGFDPGTVVLIGVLISGLVPLHATVRWWTVIPSAAGLTMLAVLAEVPLPAAAPLGSFLAAITIGLRSSLWLLELVDHIDRARQVEGRLALAEERLRFSRDLHDVMGRDLSSIAVTAELVTQLAERGDPRAAEHARSIASTARSSLADVRALVRGYREVDLASELQGTLSLLRSAGITTHVHGEAADIPQHHADAAAWVLREGGTNVLRHADATAVTITLGEHELRIVNDGARTQGGARSSIDEGTGLCGLRERIGESRALTADHDGGTFTLSVRFSTDSGFTPDAASPHGEPR